MGVVSAVGSGVGYVAKIVAFPFVKSAEVSVNFVKNHQRLAAGASVLGVGAYLAGHEDPVPAMAQKGIAELDVQGQQNAAMLNTLYASQQMSPMVAARPNSRVAANSTEYQGGQAFGAMPALGAGRGA